MSGYGTRRSSAQQTAPISISVAESPNAAANSPGALGASPYGPSAFSYGATSLSSSAGKLKRPSGINKTRRLSTSNQLRPASLLSQSMPSGPLPASGGRGRSSSISNNAHTHVHDHDFEEAESPDATHSDAAAQPHLAKLAGRKERDRIQSFECEVCSKKYRHSTCLIKHRWVQLLEGAAILVAASAGTSLPDEKSFWPAAVSPPASGLLGSLECGINVNSLASAAATFGSPRWGPSSLMSDAGDFDRSEIDEAESDDDDMDSPPPGAGNGSHDEDAQMVEDGIFDLDLGGSTELPSLSVGPSPRPAPLSRLHSDFSSPQSAVRPALRSADSGFGSLGRSSNLKEKPSSAATLAAAAGVAASGNALGIVGANFSAEQPQSIRGFDISAAR
ncbi:hypothetical protein B0A53_04924 [Rhodotorula sp. CCFEE 5036]|nr:hypothetical protein B0A53_04924 [Rhodotorula sp. CCFEE 5036]